MGIALCRKGCSQDRRHDDTERRLRSEQLTEHRRITATDWTILLLSFAVSGIVVYLVLVPDRSGKVAYYYTLYNSAQCLAAHIGQVGIRAELEYRRLLELERMI